MMRRVLKAKQVIDDKGEKGDANEAVIKALIEAGKLFARGRLKHKYPHSWRSKKPMIFRNTPQWLSTWTSEAWQRLRPCATTALKAIDETRFVPAPGKTACAA